MTDSVAGVVWFVGRPSSEIAAPDGADSTRNENVSAREGGRGQLRERTSGKRGDAAPGPGLTDRSAAHRHARHVDVIAHPEKPSHRIVKTEQFQAKPMTVDEAVMQLDLLHAKFFVFQNAKDGAINVVFRRDDGNMGLIEARGS